jgi:hypothetical protein
MATKKGSATKPRTSKQMMPEIRSKVSGPKPGRFLEPGGCDDPCVLSAYQDWRTSYLPPSFNVSVAFKPPAGKRFVIELVTAIISVPPGENARLRMFTSTGLYTGNIDLVLTFQGLSGGMAAWMATHSLRAYTDGYLEFNVNRDNESTKGQAFICVSGYLVKI